MEGMLLILGMKAFLSFFTLISEWRIVESGSINCTAELPAVRDLKDIPQSNYGRPGLAHMTIFGAANHGMKEVEVWLQTYAPGTQTPIHRHSCEEVFLVLKGKGTVCLSPDTSSRFPGKPNEFEIFTNSTFTIPVNSVHQVKNTEAVGDLQLLVIISRPPMKAFVYKDWYTPHTAARLIFPYFWDEECLGSSQKLSENDYDFDEL